ncbi:MAG: D-alanyl-D-alanine carboxypeptidase/D-alanyl-D-alanine-endopeptidase [Chitinophagaceae bacterium]|nr:D-alanyl-D-alanine carboxypeptidase/D-alanyl-D-alanine-endopeptidase [Chitinophagaceae bacterium]
MNYELKMYRHRKSLIRFISLNLSFIIFLSSCSVQKQIGRSAKENVLSAPALQTAHTGISIYEPATNKYWFNYQGDKYFVPASNTKIPTCYAAIKYLGDSLTSALIFEKDTAILVVPAGDPTLLHPDFKTHLLIDHLRKETRSLYFIDSNWKDEPLGSGWAWNDYNEYYMAERSPLPVYGNVIKWIQEKEDEEEQAVIYSIPEISWEVNFNIDEKNKNFHVKRAFGINSFLLSEGIEKKKEQLVPFVTTGIQSALDLLPDTLKKKVSIASPAQMLGFRQIIRNDLKRIYSQPTDSLLKPMMHRSDNFFAEQSLLMVSNEMLGYMNDEKIIDTLLKTDLKDLPQKPRWADGSGLSRYNLFTPLDFVSILTRMKNEFGMERIKIIFPTGGEGTLSSYYKPESGYIYAKTGTLSGVVAISGFLYTKKKKLLIFSILVNNHNNSATDVRRAVEKFVQELREKY